MSPDVAPRSAQHYDETLSPPLPAGLTYLERNAFAWDSWARSHSAAGRRAWTGQELCWGIWDTPESDLGLVEGLEPGTDVIELGCGSAAISAWLARMGMRPVGVDISREQYAIAERFQEEIGPAFTLVLANAEEVPFESESFDLVVSEYGASLWCEPRRWIAEAHRLLRPSGRLIFLTNSPLLMACTPGDGEFPSDRLVRDYFANDRLEFPGDQAVEFHLTHGEWVALLHSSGFVLENLIEPRPRFSAKARLPLVSAEWARRWPSEDIWIARKAS